MEKMFVAAAVLMCGLAVPACAGGDQDPASSGSQAQQRAAARSGYTTYNNFQPYGGSGGANTAYGPYNTAACCTFAPGGLPKGDAVEAVSLGQYSRGEAVETIPVAQEPPRYHWLFPPVRVYSLEDLRSQ